MIRRNRSHSGGPLRVARRSQRGSSASAASRATRSCGSRASWGLSDALASTYTTWNAAPSFGTRSALASRSSSVDLPQPEWPVTSSRR